MGIITAHKGSLTQHHLAAIGIEQDDVEMIGMEASESLQRVFIEGRQTLDEKKCGKEMQEAALNLITVNPDIGAIVLECTNMPPYTRIVRKVTGVPVFDMVTMINYAHSTITDRLKI